MMGKNVNEEYRTGEFTLFYWYHIPYHDREREMKQIFRAPGNEMLPLFAARAPFI